MKKIGPFLSIFSGTIILLLGAFTILAAKDIWRIPDVVGDFVKELNNKKNVAEWTAYVTMGAGLLSMLLGIFAWKKPNGFSAWILMFLFLGALGVNIYLCIDTQWTASAIISISLAGMASAGLLLGIVSK